MIVTAVNSCWQLMTADDICFDISIIIYILSVPNFSWIRWLGTELLSSKVRNEEFCRRDRQRNRDRQTLRDTGLQQGQSQKYFKKAIIITNKAKNLVFRISEKRTKNACKLWLKSLFSTIFMTFHIIDTSMIILLKTPALCVEACEKQNTGEKC